MYMFPRDNLHRMQPKYGLQEARDILNKIVLEAIEVTDKHGEKGEFLKQLAIYIKERNK